MDALPQVATQDPYWFQSSFKVSSTRDLVDKLRLVTCMWLLMYGIKEILLDVAPQLSCEIASFMAAIEVARVLRKIKYASSSSLFFVSNFPSFCNAPRHSNEVKHRHYLFTVPRSRHAV